MPDELDLRKRLQVALAENFALKEEVRQLKDLTHSKLRRSSVAETDLVVGLGCNQRQPT